MITLDLKASGILSIFTNQYVVYITGVLLIILFVLTTSYISKNINNK